MKILWVRGDLFHPLQSGGQIYSFEIARRLHQRHELHFVAYERDYNKGGVARAPEYCTALYPVTPPQSYREFRPYYLEVIRAFVQRLPFDARCLHTSQMRAAITERLASERFDTIVCDGLYIAPNLPNLDRTVLLSHNVESVMVARRTAFELQAAVRLYRRIDAQRVHALERDVCRRAAHVIAISGGDASTIRKLYGAERVTAIQTGVSADHFRRPASGEVRRKADLVFVGMMSWLPNVDGALWFANEVLPIIRRKRPDCTLALVGRTPEDAITALGRRDPRITVTGTVDDVRPWLWGGAVAIVPIRQGGGIRIKIFEAMAAGIPVVSTTIGAEGLNVAAGEHLLIADDPASFAAACVRLLENAQEASVLAERASRLVRESCSWDNTANEVEKILEAARFAKGSA